MKIKALLTAVALTALLAGCGGGSSGGSIVTVTSPASNSSSPPATTTVAPSQQQQLDAYLSGLKPLRDQANSVVDAARPTLSDFSKNPTQANADTSANDLKKAADTLNGLVPQVAAVVPPQGLDGSEFATGVQDEANNLTQLAGDVRAIDYTGIRNDVTQLDLTKAELVRWKIKVIQFASANHLTYGSWVNQVGTTK